MGADLLLTTPNGTVIPLKCDSSYTNGLNGALTRQNVVPANVQFKANLPSWDAMQPFSERSWNVGGGWGLYVQSDAPGDQNRVWQADCDTTRPDQIAANLAYPYNSGVAQAPTLQNIGFIAPVEGPDFQGFVATAYTGGGTVWLYKYDTGTHNFDQSNELSVNLAPNHHYQYSASVTRWAASCQYSRIRATNGHLWLPNNGGGVIDALAAYPQTVVDSGNNYAAVWMFADKLYSAIWKAGSPGFTIRQHDPATTTFAVSTRDALFGSANIQIDIDDEIQFHGVVAAEGSMWLTTDRSLWQIVYDENNQVLRTSQINTWTRVTSAPVTFNGDVYFGIGNRVARYTPGIRQYVRIPIDPGGTTLSPFKGMIQSLFATTDALYAVVGDAAQVAYPWAIMRMDVSGAWSALVSMANNNGPAGFGNEPIWALDNSAVGNASQTYLGFRNVAPASSVTLWPILDATDNPVTLPQAARIQQAHGWAIFPWDYKENRADKANFLKMIADGKDFYTGAARIWYQHDDDDTLADALVIPSPTPGWVNPGLVSAATPVLTGTGTWTLCWDSYYLNPAFTQQGNGAYAGLAAISPLPPGSTLGYPSVRRIRFAVEILGDTTGQYYPRLTGFKWRYVEIPYIYFSWTARIRILRNDAQAGPGIAPTSNDEAAAQYAALMAVIGTGEICTLTDPNGGTRAVLVTKETEDWRFKDDDGTPGPAGQTTENVAVTDTVQPQTGVNQEYGWWITVVFQEMEPPGGIN